MADIEPQTEEGIRPYEAAGGETGRLHRLGTGAPTSAVSVRCRPAAARQS